MSSSTAVFSTRQHRTSPCACAEAGSEKFSVSRRKSPSGKLTNADPPCCSCSSGVVGVAGAGAGGGGGGGVSGVGCESRGSAVEVVACGGGVNSSSGSSNIEGGDNSCGSRSGSGGVAGIGYISGGSSSISSSSSSSGSGDGANKDKEPSSVAPLSPPNQQPPSLSPPSPIRHPHHHHHQHLHQHQPSPPSSLEIKSTVSPERRSPVKSYANRPLTFHSILSPTPESPVTDRKDIECDKDKDKDKERSKDKEKPAATSTRDKSPSKLLGATLTASLPLRGLNVSPGMSIRRKILPHKRKLTRGMTCDTILFRPPPEIVPPRRLSSGSLTSGSENEAEHEPSPPVARRGRRSAIYETKNCGDVSPTTLSPEHSPSNSCDEGEGASNIAERLRRRRSSVDLAMNIYPGDLLVQEHHKKLIKRNTIADFYAGRSPNDGPGPPQGDGDVSKKGRQPFSLLKLMKTRSKENLTRLDDILRRLKPSEFKDNHLAAYKNVHWSDLIASTDKQNPPISISDTERKRREAVWELFKSECVFLIDHCMVLKHCFMEPLKKVQVEGSLMFAEPQDLFGNLDELCYVSYTFCKDFIAALLKDMSVTDFGRTKVLIKAFQRFSTHSKDGAVFHTYCINYTNALTYLEKLRQNPEFAEFERWCEQDPRCNRLQLTDLLVAPMQHCTKLPLLLANVRKYTESEMEQQMVTESIEKVETSLQQLEDKMKWIKNVERVQEIQRQIVWPAVAELDPRCVIPDCLKSTLSKQPCERLLTCTKRQLLHEGPLTLMESPKPIDVHVFLFDDLLLITKIKKTARKQKQGGDVGAKSPSGGAADRASYVVFRQPLAMDRFTLHDIAPADASASGLKNVMVLVHISRFQQIIGLFTLQASCDATKVTWLNQMREAKERFAESQASRQNSFKENKDPRGVADDRESRADSSRSPRRVKRNSLQRKVPAKSRSMDAVFI